MPEWIKDFCQFLKSFWPNWFAMMSGGLTVFFSFATNFWPNFLHLQTENAEYLAIICFVLTSFFLWRAEYIRLKPVLKLSFDPNPTPIPDTLSTVAYAFRLKVSTDCKERITGCSGKLLSINGPNSKWSDQHFIQLTFTHDDEDDTISKNLDSGASIFLDIVDIWNTGEVKIHSYRPLPNGVHWPSFFNGKGIYIFEILVAANKGPSASCKLKLNWSGNWKTATMEKVS